MKEKVVQKLDKVKFLKYGTYQDMLCPKGEKLGNSPTEFYYDILGVDLGNHNASFSVNQISPRKMITEKFEFHNHTGEAFLPLDGDIVIHIAPAGKLEPVPYEKIECFLIPKGTMVAMKPGVWHAAPFAAGSNPVHVLAVLPERTYMNDYYGMEFPEDERIQIVLEE